jgi:hypothetical protein
MLTRSIMEQNRKTMKPWNQQVLENQQQTIHPKNNPKKYVNVASNHKSWYRSNILLKSQKGGRVYLKWNSPLICVKLKCYKLVLVVRWIYREISKTQTKRYIRRLYAYILNWSLQHMTLKPKVCWHYLPTIHLDGKGILSKNISWKVTWTQGLPPWASCCTCGSTPLWRGRWVRWGLGEPGVGSGVMLVDLTHHVLEDGVAALLLADKAVALPVQLSPGGVPHLKCGALSGIALTWITTGPLRQQALEANFVEEVFIEDQLDFR